MEINIDFTKKYSFGQVIDKTTEDSTLSFLSKGNMYFQRDGKMYKCKYEECNVFHSTPVSLNDSVINATYYLTDFYVSNHMHEIPVNEVKDYLHKKYDVMLIVNNHTWIISQEGKVVSLDYSEVEEANEDNYLEIYAQDSLIAIFEGKWYIVEE